MDGEEARGVDKYTVKEGQVWWEGKAIGKADNILIDCHQYRADLLKSVYTEIVELPVADYVLVTRAGWVVGVEEKKEPDLYSSWYSHRLQRQLRHLLQACDVAVLGIVPVTLFGLSAEDEARIVKELMAWQLMGGLVVRLPTHPHNTVKWLREWRSWLQPGRHLLSILAGDDRQRKREKGRHSLSPCAKALSRLLVGCGPVLSEKIAAYFNYDLVTALSASMEEWAKAGGHKGILKELANVRGSRVVE